MDKKETKDKISQFEQNTKNQNEALLKILKYQKKKYKLCL